MAFAVTIICDGEGCDAEVVGPWPVTGLRRDFEDLRELAARLGWRRFRPRGADSNGDYCPACTAGLKAKRP